MAMSPESSAAPLERLADRMLAAARSREGKLVELACELIRAASVNPPGDESRPAAVVEKFLGNLGVPVKKYEAAPGRTNLIATLPVGGCGPRSAGSRQQRATGNPQPATGNCRRLLVPLHLDTVPPGDGWGAQDPFNARAEHGVIVGRGATDDKGPLAAALVAMEILLAEESPLAGELVLIAAADEERGNALGMDWLLRQDLIPGAVPSSQLSVPGGTAVPGSARAKSVSGNLEPGTGNCCWALVPDIGHSLGAVDVAEKGVAFLEVECRGRAAHGSRPQDGANAILALAEFLAEVEAWEPRERHPLLGRPTANVGTVAGGSAPNMVPDRATSALDCRYLPGMTAAGVVRHFEELARRVALRREGVSFSLKITADQPPSGVDPEHPLVGAVRELAPRITGRPVELLGLGGATFCKPLLAAGIPAVGFGPGAESAAHTAGESVEIRELVEFAAFVAALARHLLG